MMGLLKKIALLIVVLPMLGSCIGEVGQILLEDATAEQRKGDNEKCEFV